MSLKKEQEEETTPPQVRDPALFQGGRGQSTVLPLKGSPPPLSWPWAPGSGCTLWLWAAGWRCCWPCSSPAMCWCWSRWGGRSPWRWGARKQRLAELVTSRPTLDPNSCSYPSFSSSASDLTESKNKAQLLQESKINWSSFKIRFLYSCLNPSNWAEPLIFCSSSQLSHLTNPELWVSSPSVGLDHC